MMLIGVDYHPSFQTIAFFVEEAGECGEQALNHSDGQAERFYRDLKQRGICVRVGMEATGYSRWFERLLAELGFELWQIGTYVGMIPCEESSARKQRLGHISKQGSSLLRFLLVGAAQAAARIHPHSETSVHAPGDASTQKYCQASNGT